MKKFLTLALALVLVFAIAAPALAITGETLPAETTPTGVAPVRLAVDLFKAAPVYSYNAVLSFNAVAAEKAYIVNEIAFWGVKLDFVKPAAGEVLAMAADDYDDAKLLVSCDAFVPTQTATYWTLDGGNFNVGSQTLVLNADKKLEYMVEDFLWGKDYDLYFFGQGLVAAKGVFKAELVKTKTLVAEGAAMAINVAGKLAYEVLKTNWGYRVTIKSGDYAGKFVDFVVNQTTKAVTAIEVDDRAVLYTIPVSNEGAVLESIGGAKEGTQFAADKAAYLQVMTFFGFNYNAKGALLDKHFTNKAATLNLKAEKAVQLYTAAIVIPGTVEPPKTGDASTVIGFVMIAVAMIAAGVVVSRKVRA